MKQLVHLKGQFAGVSMVFSACGEHVEPFATNLTTKRKLITCRKCQKLYKFRRSEGDDALIDSDGEDVPGNFWTDQFW